MRNCTRVPSEERAARGGRGPRVSSGAGGAVRTSAVTVQDKQVSQTQPLRAGPACPVWLLLCPER